MKFLNKKIKMFFLLSIALTLLIYVSNITGMPNKIILFEGENINIKTALGVSLESRNIDSSKNKTIQTSTSINKTNLEEEQVQLTATLFGKIPVKEIDVNIIEETSVIPMGDLVGLKLYTNGVLVVGMSEIEAIDNKKYKPYEKSDIKEGDMIVKINETAVTCTSDLVNIVDESGGNEIDVTYIREEQYCKTTIKPVQIAEEEYKIGLWVRDAAAGVGTMSFYEPSTKMFASLGHGILDIDTEQLLDIAKGEFVKTKVIGVQKGEEGTPGKIQGSIDKQEKIGEVYKNTMLGVYGKTTNLSSLNIDLSNAMKVALRDEIKKGKASIICTLENNQKKEYEIEIEKIYKNNNIDNKSMLIKVIDEELLNKTGGIIQGMSGAPIIQNGKFIGAVTHVLVTDPTTGYGIFGDMMIKQLREVSK